MSELLTNFESYILNEANMQNYLKYKLTNISDNVKKSKIENKIDNKVEYKNKYNKTSQIFIPREQDSLFWCYYIIKNGDIKYEMLKNRNTLTSKQLKIEYISNIRENSARKIAKTYKFDTLTNIESNLANDNTLSIKTFMTLCAVDNINVIFINKKTYYELLTNDSDIVYIINEIDNSQLKYNKQYGYEIATKELLDEISSNFYKTESLDKPIKSLSAYKVSDLLNIAKKLAIETLHKESGKNKTKNELYESIIQYF
jgi:hypothetical protein